LVQPEGHHLPERICGEGAQQGLVELLALAAVVGHSPPLSGRGNRCHSSVPTGPGRCRDGRHKVGPMAHGANSSSPTPLISLLVSLPLATARPSSKICRPTASTGVPSRMTPALMSMSSVMCRYSGVLVATLIDGAGLQPNTEPRPVVNTSTLA